MKKPVLPTLSLLPNFSCLADFLFSSHLRFHQRELYSDGLNESQSSQEYPPLPAQNAPASRQGLCD
jgi:hypothetical protein